MTVESSKLYLYQNRPLETLVNTGACTRKLTFMALTYGVIPARGGSKSVPGKNKRLVGGKPLIWHTCQEALKSRLDQVYLDTDDEEIIDLVRREFPQIQIPYKRPAHLAADDSKALEVALNFLEHCKVSGTVPEWICWLQPTSPLRTAQDINNCLELESKSNSVVSVVDVGACHPHKMKVIKDGFLVPQSSNQHTDNSNRQQLPATYVCNGAIFLASYECLVNQRTFYGDRCIPYIMEKERSINIDDEYEIAIADFLLKRRLNG